MILSWDKPDKLLPTEEHNRACSSDCGVPGTYVPNMSIEDREKYKAKIVKGKLPRVEIRVTIEGTQVLAKVKTALLVPDQRNWQDPVNDLIRDHGSKNIKISMNGALNLSFEEWEQFKQAMDEAIAEAKKLPA